MNKILFATLLLLMFAACSEPAAPPPAPETNTAETTAPAETQTETERLNAWFDEKYEEQLQLSPIAMTFQGIKQRYDELDDYSVEAEEARLEWRRQSVEEMQREFDYDALTQEAQTSWDIWTYQYEQAALAAEFRYNGLVFEQMNGAQGFLPTFLISFHNVADVSDYEAFVSRLSETGRALRQLIERAEESAQRGVITPGFALEKVIDQSQNVITGAPFTDGEDAAIWAAAKTNLATLVDAGQLEQPDADALLERTETALMQDFAPAFEGIVAWAESEMDKVPEVSTGLVSQPNGEAYYEYRLANQTTTDLSADEIHDIGLADVARLRGEMEAVKDSTGFDGTLQEFFVMLRETRDDERFYYPNNDEGRQGYIDDATAAIENIKAQLPNYFATLPQADLVVRRVEAFREQDGAPQHYYAGTPDGSRPGVYYAHLSDMNAMPKSEMEVIAYHEGLPGHHMQISIAQELEDMPRFRTQAGFTAYSEGWGLYSERLASEMPDTYEDPYSQFGRLTSEMWRAIRLVVDTGLHSKGWTEQEAIDYFAANSSVPLAAITTEVQRYIVMPAQATSYKIGMIKILELRETARDALGDDFDIREFHDAILLGGAMPLHLLERRVNQWIEEVQARS
ncbi:DUF885 domain-containing protein [Pseudohongiella sp.]|uniref:DUF885 domain-containing protein n=3 Tax=root TaxID=1 RepID=A0A0F9VXR9_9ZZZZ|nr:DUF885 domain-containing protein [Pseudohongiella sp.]HDZ08625.1 DUF885 domain-containing protein [Pseudohongiella sp.]